MVTPTADLGRLVGSQSSEVAADESMRAYPDHLSQTLGSETLKPKCALFSDPANEVREAEQHVPR